MKSPTNFPQKLKFWLEVPLHVVNLRHGTNGFTSLTKEVILRIFTLWKNPSTPAEIEPANLGSRIEYDNHWTTGVDCYTLDWHISYISYGVEGWLGFLDFWSGQKPWWNWYLITVVNFGEVKKAHLAKTTLRTSTLVPLGFFRYFKVCSYGKERVECGKQRDATAPNHPQWNCCLGSWLCSEWPALAQNNLMIHGPRRPSFPHHHRYHHHHHHHQSVLPMGRSFHCKHRHDVTAAVLRKDKSFTANSGSKFAVSLGLNKCDRF